MSVFIPATALPPVASIGSSTATTSFFEIIGIF
ncbi:MAG: hypothetical protein UV86_C0021G0010 [Candidatus Nomurabacteria bacterium GW2011_GWB1_43_20]|nr:MAG: hypothetical protein UV86_C0021G0010 [Candidatus Nomurabacteria bacterium GW2011_GWB1_43_20]